MVGTKRNGGNSLRVFLRICAGACTLFSLGIQISQLSPLAAQVPANQTEAASTDRDHRILAALKTVATEEVSANSFLGKTRLNVTSEGHLQYDLRPVASQFVIPNDGEFEVPLEALIRVWAFQRDARLQLPQTTFWVAPADAIE